MSDEHRRAADGYINTDPGIQSKRDYEKTLGAKFAILSQRLGPWALGAFTFVMMLGFGFKTPQQHFEEIAEASAITNARINEVEKEQQRLRQMLIASNDSTNTMLQILIRLRCLDLTDREKATFNICD